MNRVALVWAVLLIGCGENRVRDFYTPEERASVQPVDAGTPLMSTDAGPPPPVMERLVTRLSVPCPGAISVMPETTTRIRCVNQRAQYIGYLPLIDETCADSTVTQGPPPIAPMSEGQCELAVGKPYRVFALGDSGNTLLRFRVVTDQAVLVVEP